MSDVTPMADEYRDLAYELLVDVVAGLEDDDIRGEVVELLATSKLGVTPDGRVHVVVRDDDGSYTLASFPASWPLRHTPGET